LAGAPGLADGLFVKQKYKNLKKDRLKKKYSEKGKINKAFRKPNSK